MENVDAHPEFPLEVRRQIWTWKYAYRAFHNCEISCRYILSHNLTDDDPIFYSLTSAAFIAYARPFSNNRGLDPLTIAIVPSEYKKVHQQVIDARHQVYAHLDAKNELHWEGTPAVDVVVRIISPGHASIGAMEATTTTVGFERLAKLAKILCGKCEYHVGKCAKKYRSIFPTVPGDYHLGVKDGEDPFTRVKTKRF